MRVMLLVTDLERGGTPLRVARLARALHAADVDVVVGCLAPPGPISRDLEQAGIETFACDARSPRDWHVFRRLRTVLRKRQPDVLHAHLMHANVAARFAAYRLLPVLTSTATIEVTRRWHLWLERLTHRLDAGHVVNSPALAKHVRERIHVPADRVFEIPPLIQPPASSFTRSAARQAYDIPDDAYAIAWAGRLDPVKRVDVLIDALADPRLPHAMLLIAGDGPQKGELESRAARRSVADRVRFLGWQPELGRVFAAADVFALPSQTEGAPNALLEALAFGLPAVTSDIPAVRDFVPTECVTLVNPPDVAGCAAALQSLRDDASARAVQAERGRTWARELTSEQRVVNVLIGLYAQVARRAR